MSHLSRRQLLKAGLSAVGAAAGLAVVAGLSGCTGRNASSLGGHGGAGTPGWEAIPKGTGQAVPPGPAVLQPDPGRAVRIVASETDWELAPGKVVRAMAYNGRVPGPLLRLREGERVRFELVNQLKAPTTIHWHGLNVPTHMDGVPDVSQPPVAAGASFTYDFVAKPAGTRWYHSHVKELEQIGRGLFGAVVIDPADSAQESYDRDYTLIFNEWYVGGAKLVPPAPYDGGMGGMMGMMSAGVLGDGMTSATRPKVDTFTINGKAYPATEELLVKQGERVRLRLINASADLTHHIALAGHTLKVTHADGNPLAEPVVADVVEIAPAERVDVEFVADKPGAYQLGSLDPRHRKAGMVTVLRYAGTAGGAVQPVPDDERGLRLWSLLTPARGGTRPDDDQRFLVELGGGMMGAEWSINGKSYPRTDPFTVKQGQKIAMLIVNRSMESHPMHLHGHSFQVRGIGGELLRQPVWKDTVNVLPMGSAEIAFTADNPGDWFFHCHKPMHMDAGMIALVRYQK